MSGTFFFQFSRFLAQKRQKKRCQEPFSALAATQTSTPPTTVRASAFTLLEVLAALAILAIALTALLHLHLHSLRATARTDLTDHASLLAQQKLEETIARGFPSPGQQTGHTTLADRDFQWRIETSPFTPPAQQPNDFAPLRRIAVTVTAPGLAPIQLSTCITSNTRLP